MTDLSWLKAELESLVSLDYAAAKARSEALDLKLGFSQQEIEDKLIESFHVQGGQRVEQRWIGLPLQAMQTPYGELVEFVATLAPKATDTWVDLGAAYGRLGIVLAALAPQTRFIGYELVRERVLEGQAVYEKLLLTNAKLIEQDLSAASFTPATAECYFLYDFGTREAIEKALVDLRDIAAKQPIAVVARGRGCRNLIDRGQPWLTEIVEPMHRAHYSIYRSRVG